MAEDTHTPTEQDNPDSNRTKRLFWDSKPWQAFKTFAIIFSFTVNVVVLIVLLAILPLILPIVDIIAKPLVGGLNDSFVDMSEATISRTIAVNDELDIAFTLPLATDTVVTVTENVPLSSVPARFVLPGGGGYINGFVSLELPQGLQLPVYLSLEVPVEQTIPVNLSVAVEIPLNETELGKPFNTLVSLFTPLDEALESLPGSNQELFDRLRAGPPAPPEE
jgi:hypothetical protein